MQLVFSLLARLKPAHAQEESRDVLMNLLDAFITMSNYSLDEVHYIGGLYTYVNKVKSLISMYV